MKFHKRIKKKIEHKDNNWLPYTIATCSAVVLFLLLNNLPELYRVVGRILTVLKPVLIGVIIAYLLNPLVKFFDRLFKPVKSDNMRNGIAIVLASVSILVFITILMSFLIPQIMESAVQFATNFNAYSIAVNDLIARLEADAEAYNLDMNALSEIIESLVQKIAPLFSQAAEKLLNKSFSIGGNAANFFIGLIVALYFLASKKSIFKGFDTFCVNMMEEKRYHDVKTFFQRCNKIFSAFIVQDLIDSLIVGVVNFVFMSLMAMPYTVLISVVVGATNLAPTFGPFVGAFIGGFVLLFANAKVVIPFLLFTLVLQLIDGYVIKPKLFGETMGVAGVWITVGIIIGGKLFGVTGILLAVPLLGIATFMYKDFISAKEKERLSAAAQKAAPVDDGVREEPNVPDEY